MFMLEQPSMALNDFRISWSRIVMWNTGTVIQSHTPDHVIDWVATVARGAPGGKLKNLVLNSHGLPAFIQIGQSGFGRGDTGMFSAWAGLVEKIWIVACLVARIPTPQYQAQLNSTCPSLSTGDGNIFCSEISRNAHCHVVASTESQRNLGGYALGQMPTFEGLLLSYSPNGAVSWSHRYASDWESNRD